MTYHIGQQLPLINTRKVLGEEIDPTWYILTTPPQRETAATAWLERIGAGDVWHPTETRYRPQNGRRVAYERCIAPGYLFAMFESAPQWDVMYTQGKNRVSGVVSFGEVPYAVPESVLADMQHVPQRIEQARLAAIEEARLARLATQVVDGSRAKLEIGPLSGFLVDVSRVNKGIAHFVYKGIKGQAKVDDMKRVD